MKLSTRSTYGMRAMLELALAVGQGPVMVREIADRQHLPATYLEQLMVLLRKAGLVSATRGAHGGYALAREPRDITVAEIIAVLEGPLELVDCPSGAGCCGQPEVCALCDVWDDAGKTLTAFFQSMTLASLAERQRAKCAAPVLMYAI
ncbi:MAG TPA: RrF2 family transcriptional regulator [Armatimonadota bacterium]|nr:RrF2 family transcriptional regulator [Armatimonadota bacterium]HOS42493.1 RrF2 family transcriptional regulator [Armatimonadota bacterium]